MSSFGQDRSRSIRIVTDGKTVYSLDMRLDETFGDAAITFHGTPGVPMTGGNAFNAWGRIDVDPGTNEVILKFNDMSLLKTLAGESTLTVPQFINALWEEICDEVERESQRR